jgi:hypothetical protein
VTNAKHTANRPGRYKENSFGGIFGGPLILPGYNGRNRTFFTMDAQRTDYSQVDPYTQTVPTSTMQSSLQGGGLLRTFRTRLTGDYMRREGLNVIFALNHPNGTVTNLTDAIAADYVQYVKSLLGILGDWTSTSTLTTPCGLPVVTQVQINNVAQGQTALASAANSWPGSSPLFVALSAIAWNMTPTTVTQLAPSLGPQYEVVRADVFFKLLRQTLGSA